MIVLKTTRPLSGDEVEGAEMSLAGDGLAIIVNSLNEVCNGIDVEEFATRIGAEREDVVRLLEQIGSSLD